jgi:hypothetical protein
MSFVSTRQDQVEQPKVKTHKKQITILSSENSIENTGGFSEIQL